MTCDQLWIDYADTPTLRVEPVSGEIAANAVCRYHYLHRETSISYAFGLIEATTLRGVITFGTPPSRHLQISACPSDPDKVIELNRLWVHDDMPQNTESWFVSRALKMMPPRIIVSYADLKFGHTGYIYRALNFHYAGWTSMERKTPRLDYIPTDSTKHTRDAFRSGVAYTVRRSTKIKYWTVTGDRSQRRALTALCGWPQYNWKTLTPPDQATP